MQGNLKEKSVHIDIRGNSLPSKEIGVVSNVGKATCKWLKTLWEFCKQDPSSVTFSVKVGLALLLVSLLLLIRKPYDAFGSNVIWAILTVVVVFEKTVGGTFSRGFNRALGSIAAGILALLVAQLALMAGMEAEPIIIGFSIFFFGALATFMKQWPSLKEYEYGFRVYLFTFCLIIVSAYRLGNPVRTTMDRIYSISIGGAAPMLISVVVLPSWSGEKLHQQIVENFELVADSLEECVKLYLEESCVDHARSKQFMDMESCDGEPAFKKYKTAMDSSAGEDTLANSAKWELPHGRFKHFFYPWSQYVKVGAVLRHCAYEVTALHRCLHSELQAPQYLRNEFGKELRDASSNAAKLIRRLAKNINNMQNCCPSLLIKKVHAASACLQYKIDTHSNLILLNTSSNCEAHDNSCSELVPPEMKKLHRKLHSWPSLAVDMLEEGHEQEDESLADPVKPLESINALSFITFSSLLIQFLARLDYLVETVEELGRLAKFKHG